jgi:hypothetical protein
METLKIYHIELIWKEKKQNLDYYILPHKQGRDFVNVGIMRLGHVGGLFFQGTVKKDNNQYCLLGDFIEDTPESRGNKQKRGSIIFLAVSVLVAIYFIIWFPLYFIITDPWWASVLIALSVCIFLVLIFTIDRHVKRNKYSERLQIDKIRAIEIFISILVDKLNFNRVE